MKVHSTGLLGMYLIEPKLFTDSRGFFIRNYLSYYLVTMCCRRE
jgi:dTDP-4-dehydrorhamnose 3,5-epimerase-like enzyme